MLHDVGSLRFSGSCSSAQHTRHGAATTEPSIPSPLSIHLEERNIELSGDAMAKGLLLWSALAALALFSLGSLSAQAFTAQPSTSIAQPDETSAIETLRSDIHADRVAAIRRDMQFNSDESAAFWPIYNQYAAEMSKANDDRVAVVREYADKYANLTDADAAALTARMFAFEQHRLDVKKKYCKEFSSKLPGKTVTKFFQLEHRFDLVIDLELASRLPTVLDQPSNF
jgi:hypothetical protein